MASIKDELAGETLNIPVKCQCSLIRLLDARKSSLPIIGFFFPDILWLSRSYDS